MDRLRGWRNNTNVGFITVVDTEGVWFVEFIKLLYLVIIIPWVLFVVEIRILRHSLDWEVAWLGNVPNKPGVDIVKVNRVVADLRHCPLLENINIILLVIIKDGVEVVPHIVELRMDDFPSL